MFCIYITMGELHYGDIYQQVEYKINVNEELRLQYKQINMDFHI